jgi:putative ABC transport system ATP-binding protein
MFKADIQKYYLNTYSINKDASMSFIELHNVKKIYNGNGITPVHALRGVDLSIESGEFVAIMGPSGSGKSTLLTILGGLSHPSEGTVIVDEIDLYDLPGERLADFRSEYLGFVFQSFQLIPYLTALENVILPLAITDVNHREQRERAEALLDRVGLKDRMHRLPDQLSGGEQERVAIARALINDPAVVLADEPTGNLDSKTGGEILDLFQELNDDGRTIIMVTHGQENAQRAGRIVTLQDGCVINTGVLSSRL